MPHWKGTGLSGSKTIELYESPTEPPVGPVLGGLSSLDDGSFICVYSAAALVTDPGSDRGVQFELDAEDEAAVQTYFPVSATGGILSLSSLSATSGSFTFRVKALGTGARLRAIWTGSTSLGEAYALEVTLMRLPQPQQPIPYVIT